MGQVVPLSVGASKTVLLTLGRLPVALEIARAFHSRGWRVIVAETLGWHQCRLSTAIAACHVVVSPVVDHRRHKRQLLDVIKLENVSLVVPVSEEILYVARIRDQLPNDVTLLAMNSTMLDQLHDKWLFTQWAMYHEYPVPLTALGSSDAAEQLIENHAYVIKPRLSCSGVGVVYGNKGVMPDPELLADDHIVQVRLTENRCSSFVMSSHGKCLVIVTYQSLLDSGSVAARFERIETPYEIKHFNETVVSQLDYSGMISFDFMENHERRWQAIECNPRANSGLHLVSPQQIVASFLAMENPALIDRISEPFSNYAAAADLAMLPTETKRQELWSAFTETNSQLCRGKFSLSLWKQLFCTRDISWSKRDWKPCVLMPFASWQLLWWAIRRGKPISQVAMLDVGWYHALSDQADDIISPVVTISTEVPADYETLVESVAFGTEGLRYQRRNALEQLKRFNEPVFITAHMQDEIVGVYVLDKRQLMMGDDAVTGYYRSVLAVATEWQGLRVGVKMTNAAMDWIEEQAALSSQPVLSYGCIEADNIRSITLLEKQGASISGVLSQFMMYRHWPRSKTELVEIADSGEHNNLLGNGQEDCVWRDVTAAPIPKLGFVDEEGVRISASVSLSESCIMDRGNWPRWITRLLVTLWPPARKRFKPEQFRSVVFSQIAIRPECEDDWSDFVSAVLAQFKVNFATVYSDPQSKQFNELLRTGFLGRRLHSNTGSIQLMAKVHSGDGVRLVEADDALEDGVEGGVEGDIEGDIEGGVEDDFEPVEDATSDEFETTGESESDEIPRIEISISSYDVHALYPVDG